MDTINKLSLTVNFEKTPQPEVRLLGFLFWCNGIFIQRQYVNKNLLEFNLADSKSSRQGGFQANEVRVLIVPETDKSIQKITSMDALEPYKPYEPVLARDAKGNFSILAIPASVAQFWPVCQCRVTGKVSKWFHAGNVWTDRAVCRARVHICEVDPIFYWIYRIPDHIIAKVPDAILNPKEIVRFPIPMPDPPPLDLRSLALTEPQEKVFVSASAEEKQMEAAAALPELGFEIRKDLASGNLHLIRQTIAKNYALFHPWFCLFPWWWPWFYRCTERKIVYTDANGRFDTNIDYCCFGDKPDVYLWIEYLVNGVWTTVYNPPIPCNTLWDYACGTNINIHITDPRVPGDCCCNCPLPGELVFIRSIGSTSVSHINQQSYLQAPPGQTVSYNRIGLTDAGAIGDGIFTTTVGDYKRPFGGGLNFYMGFGSDLPNTGIYYYRWKYRKVANADLTPVSGTVHHLSAPEMKGYDFEYTDSNGDQQIGHNSVKLGPFTVGSNDDLFIIPPSNPAMAPFNATESDPQWFERTHNTHTAGFDSSSLKNGAVAGGDGLYAFYLELFDKNGNLLSNIPKTTFKVPDFNDANNSVNAPDMLLDGATAATADAFRMLVRVDNSHCQSNLYTIKVNGAPAATDCCGFVKYKPGNVEADLEITFLASHPNNFGAFSFGVTRGTCGAVSAAGASGLVIDSADGYTMSGGLYDKHFTPAQLLETCYAGGTGKAAFAETLSVIAMATDGTFRQSSKDAPYRVAAFALEP
ncbi:MAG: hypothetical protein KGO82_09685 [Bacteroidota bacterium]|nr:hypothetical protein [Bacteroidota bacterium]